MRWLVVLPILVPFLAAALLLPFRGSAGLRRWGAVLGTAAALLSALALVRGVSRHGTLATQMGGWPAPFGISFVADRLGALMTLVTAALISACVVYSQAASRSGRLPSGYYPYLLTLLAGANGAFLTGDLFNLYVWLEVLLMSSFSLLALGGRRALLRAAVPYLMMSLVASVLLLVAIGLIYGLAGTLNMADLSRRIHGLSGGLSAGSSVGPSLAASFMPAGILFLGALGIKAAVFPLFFWLPRAYPAAAVEISAAFSGTLTKVAVYAMIRFSSLFLGPGMEALRPPLLVVAGATMVTGVLGAASQNEFRRILSFHIVSQIGYMIMGLALFTPLALAGAVYFIIHNIYSKANLFLISGVTRRLGGSFELKRLGGVYRAEPFLSMLFLVSAFSLAGLPPLSGFWGKFLLARAGLESREFLLVAISLIVGILTLFSMTKIWLQVFWKPAPPGTRSDVSREVSLNRENRALLLAPIAALALLTIALGVFVDPVMGYLAVTGNELVDPWHYIAAVPDRGGMGE